jgi:hypothetical protein
MDEGRETRDEGDFSKEGYKSMSVALVSIEKIGKCP